MLRKISPSELRQQENKCLYQFGILSNGKMSVLKQFVRVFHSFYLNVKEQEFHLGLVTKSLSLFFHIIKTIEFFKTGMDFW